LELDRTQVVGSWRDRVRRLASIAATHTIERRMEMRSSWKSWNRPRILVVEPDRDQRVVFNRLLGYELDVLLAADVAHALRMIAAEGPFEAVVDNARPGGALRDGLERLKDPHTDRVIRGAACRLSDDEHEQRMDVARLRAAIVGLIEQRGTSRRD
jgi:CheY-like chemotaxis protein